MNLDEIDELRAEIDDLKEQVEMLKSSILAHSHLMRFHKLDEIDQKYIKHNPLPNEYPFFETPDSIRRREYLESQSCVVGIVTDGRLPKMPPVKVLPEDYGAAAGRMKGYKESECNVVLERESEARRNAQEIQDYIDSLKKE